MVDVGKPAPQSAILADLDLLLRLRLSSEALQTYLGSVIFVLIYFLVLDSVLVFQLFFRFSFVLVFIIFSF